MSDSGSAWRPTVPGYEIVREIGRGGFAVVHEAIQTSIDRPVALKVINLGGINADTLRRFRSECRTVGRLSRHPHVIALYDAGETAEGAPYLAMEMCPEGSLGDRVTREGPLSPDEVIKVGLEVADALTAAHEAGIIHRDIKPDNLMLGYRGEVLLADFGIATLTDGTASATGSFVGSLAYSAPELLRGERASAVTDVYSLGATLYTLSVGKAAFAGGPDDTPVAVMWRVTNEDPPPLPDSIPAGLAGIIATAMSKASDTRYPTMAALSEALGDASAQTAGGSAKATARDLEVPSDHAIRVDSSRPITPSVNADTTTAAPAVQPGLAEPPPTGPYGSTAAVTPSDTVKQQVIPDAPSATARTGLPFASPQREEGAPSSARPVGGIPQAWGQDPATRQPQDGRPSDRFTEREPLTLSGVLSGAFAIIAAAFLLAFLFGDDVLRSDFAFRISVVMQVAATVAAGIALLAARRIPWFGSGAVVGVACTAAFGYRAFARVASCDCDDTTRLDATFWLQSSAILIVAAAVLSWHQRPRVDDPRRPSTLIALLAVGASLIGPVHWLRMGSDEGGNPLNIASASYFLIDDSPGRAWIGVVAAAATAVVLPLIAGLVLRDRRFAGAAVLFYAVGPMQTMVAGPMQTTGADRSQLGAAEAALGFAGLGLLVGLGIALLASPRATDAPAGQT